MSFVYMIISREKQFKVMKMMIFEHMKEDKKELVLEYIQNVDQMFWDNENNYFRHQLKDLIYERVGNFYHSNVND